MSQAETALQILGSAALIQLFVKKFLFAKVSFSYMAWRCFVQYKELTVFNFGLLLWMQDRQKTVQELQAFLDTKIAPKELVDELKVCCQ